MTAIVPARRHDEGNLVRFAHRDVAADVRLDEDGRGRPGSYVIRMAASEQPARGRLIAVRSSGDIVELGSLDVAANSVGASRFALLPLRTAFTGVFLEIRCGEMMLRVAAPDLPAARNALRGVLVGGAIAAAGVALGTAGAVVSAMLPQTPVIAIPARVFAGEVATLPYETHGPGTTRVTATVDDRTMFDSGPLNAMRGEIALPVPAGAARKRVSILVEKTNALGRAARTAAFVAVPMPPPVHAVTSVARIVTLSARRESGPAGESVLASYLAVGDGGALSVTDSRGNIVARAPFTRRGTQRLTLPAAVVLEPVAVRLSVERDGQRATAGVDLPPASAPAAAPVVAAGANAAADELPASVDAADERPAVGAKGSDIFAVAGRAIAGRPFTVLLSTPAAAMRMRLEDDAGSALEDVAVPDGARTITLTAPAGPARTYFLACSYGRGNAQEVVVRSLRVFDR